MRNGCGRRWIVMVGFVPGGGAFSVKRTAQGCPMHLGSAGALGSGAVGGGASGVGGSVPFTTPVVAVVPAGPSSNAYTPNSWPAAATPGSRMPATATTVSPETATPPAIPPASCCDQSTAPECASTARSVKSVVLPENATPFTIALGANVGAGSLCCHATAPDSASRPCRHGQ